MFLDFVLIGTRKCATTWIYENLLREPAVNLNSQVKESTVFDKFNESRYKKYQKQFQADGKLNAEINPSICYSEEAMGSVSRCLKPGAPVWLIIRNPIDYYVSRYHHSFRKGEYKGSMSEFYAVDWLQRELDYSTIVASAQKIFGDNVRLICYEAIVADQNKVYSTLLDDLGLKKSNPRIEAQINLSRHSKAPTISQLLTAGAVAARRMGLHLVVNSIKATGLKRMTEIENPVKVLGMERETSKAVVEEHFQDALKIWGQMSEG